MRYFFHLFDDIDTVDEVGTNLSNLDAAIAYALDGVRSLAAETVREGRLACHHRIEIADSFGKLLRTIRFDEAVVIKS